MIHKNKQAGKTEKLITKNHKKKYRNCIKVYRNTDFHSKNSLLSLSIKELPT